MKSFIVLVLFFFFGLGLCYQLRFCPNGDSDVLDCIEHFFDANGDQQITAIEIDNTLAEYPQVAALLTGVTGDSVLAACDFDQNGVLDMVDWNHPSRAGSERCLGILPACDTFCWYCKQNGWVAPSKK